MKTKLVTAFAFIVFLLVLGVTMSSPPLTAEKIQLPKFKNVDEAIGWVKAKGTCEKIGGGRGERCKIRVELPNDKRPEAKGRESVWEVWAWMEVFDLEPLRGFTVSIIRSRYASLSASDAKMVVRSVKSSRYHFEKNGKVSEVSIGFVLENFKEEKILDAEIPVPKEYPHIHGEGAGDMILFMEHLGIAWKYR